MHELVVSAGVPEERVFRIPIGIDLETFPFRDEAAKAAARAELGLPSSAFVVGSFQKDGVGWDEGLEPKLVKGPDVLVAALEHVRRSAPELHVLLTGPARGYVRRALESAEIAHTHLLAKSRTELAQAYRALDVYVVSSRQEGGPKSVLESMASGVPLVSTRVGQAQDLVVHGRTGWLAEVEDAERLAELAVTAGRTADGTVLSVARETAESHALDRLDGLWAGLFDGFVEGEER
jgi:glycosyltransferase involved in cell wall biosynthesis